MDIGIVDLVVGGQQVNTFQLKYHRQRQREIQLEVKFVISIQQFLKLRTNKP